MAYKIGIDAIDFYTPQVYLDLEDLAVARQTPVDKFKIGIGQEKMSLIEPFEDIVTMAAEASHDLVKGREDLIGLVLFATESGVDFSKAASIYLHNLLGLKPHCRVLEVKQACYAATGALMLAKDYVASHPEKVALVVASDVAWYGFNSPGEVTQGAGAVAMIISSNPRLAEIIEGKAIVENMADFYRPAYHEVPIVDGKLSIRSYKELLKAVRFDNPLKYVCFHMPFAVMSDKASETLIAPLSLEVLSATKMLNKVVGNIYNGSLYLSLISLLITITESLSHETIGMFSYGSGATGEAFTLKVAPTYLSQLNRAKILTVIDQRNRVDMATYEKLMNTYAKKEQSLDYQAPMSKGKHRYCLVEIKQGHRQYQRIELISK
jgi:hydroxymethylglutaryl-CoA synthase